MAQALPLAKLGSLLIKTLAKPLSKRVKHEFSRYSATKNMLIFIGQTTHVVTSRMKIWSAGYRVRSITPLETEKALADGADMVGETFIFGVSGGIVVWEYNRSKEKDKAKEAEKIAKQKEENAGLRSKLHALDLRLKAVEIVVKENSQSLYGLGRKKYVAPAQNELVPITEDDDDAEKALKIIPPAQTNTIPQGSSMDTKKPWWKIW